MISDLSKRKIPTESVLFVLLTIFWGGSFVTIEVGLHYVPPLLFAGARYALAGAVILAYAIVRTDHWRPRGREEYLAVSVVGAFVIAAYHALLYLGEQHVSGAIAAVVISLSPVLTAGFAVLLLDERLTLPKAVGFALGMCGVAVVAGVTPANALSADVVGVGLVLLGGACFALGSVLTEPLQTDLPIVSLQAWAMLGGSGLLFAGSALRGESVSAIHVTPTALASFAYLTLISGVVAFLLYFRLLGQVGPTRLNLVGYLEPVVATLLSWAVLGEVVGTTTLAGFTAIFAGFAVLNRGAVRTLAESVVPKREEFVSVTPERDENLSEDSDASETAWSGSAGPADD